MGFLFFIRPALPIAPHILAAVLPAAYLLRYIYRHDTVEAEPPGLLASLLGLGVLAALLSAFLEGVAERILDRVVWEDGPVYTILFAFLVVAAVEEGTKFLLMKWRTWRDPAFNYRFDAVIYAVFVSLGFAAFENIQYVLGYGLSVAIPRALLSVPGHMAFGVFMGVFYGRAKILDSLGRPFASWCSLWAGYLVAVFLHGVYDACALSGSALAMGIFLVFVLLMFAGAYRTIHRESARDMRVS